MANIFDLAVANGFDASFVYEHNLEDLSRLNITPGTPDLIDSIENTNDDGTDAQQVADLTDRPEYGVASLNGIKIATFQNQGTQQNLDILGPRAAAIAGATGFSWFMVLRRQGALTLSGGRFWSNEKAGTPNGIQWQERNAVTTSDSMRSQTDFVGDVNEAVDVPAAVGTDFVQVTCQWSPARGRIQLRVDQVDGEFNNNNAAVTEGGMTTSAYGKRSNTATSNISRFDLAHFALFDSDLSNADRQLVENLLKQQWFLPPVTDIAALNFDLKAGPTISALLDITTPTTMDLVVEPSITSKLAINPSRGTP